MKKILVLGALSLFGLGGEAEAMYGAAADPAASTQRQETGIIEVKRNVTDRWEDIPLADLKADTFHSVVLSALGGKLSKESIQSALITLSCGPETTQADTMTPIKGLTAEQQSLYNLASAKFKEFCVNFCNIDDGNLPLFIRAIENNPSLERVEFWCNKVNITTKGALDLCNALKTLPILGSVYISTNIRNMAPTVVDTLHKLTSVRYNMLRFLKEYIRTNDKMYATGYEEHKEKVKQLTAELDRKIAAARAKLAQE